MKKFKFKIDNKDYEVDIKSVEDNLVNLEVNGNSYSVELEEEFVAPKVNIQPEPDVKPILPNKQLENSSSVAATVTSPLPGNIIRIEVKEGDTVSPGTLLLVMESMKMENNINSDVNGVVKKIHVSAGQAVMQDDTLIEIA